MRRAVAVAVALAALGVAACGAEQDPGITPGTSGTVTTSRPLAPCPHGGPDATTPAAGCLDPDGKVVRPGG